VIEERLAEVHERIARAAARAGRGAAEITLVAVSKVKPVCDIIAAYEAGQRHFGENYVQDFSRRRRPCGFSPARSFTLSVSCRATRPRPQRISSK
jgi:hypothetical protein